MCHACLQAYYAAKREAAKKSRQTASREQKVTELFHKPNGVALLQVCVVNVCVSEYVYVCVYFVCDIHLHA